MLRSVTKASQTKRGRRRRATDGQFGEQAERCRRSPCEVCRVHGLKQSTETHPHHEPTVARGGKDRDTVPLCRNHHNQRHRMGARRFWTFYGINVADLVRRMRDPLQPRPDEESIPW